MSQKNRGWRADTRKGTAMKQNLIIRISSIFFVIAGAGVMVDALWNEHLGIAAMWFGILLGSSGLVLFLRRQAGWWAAGLGLAGVLLILGAENLYPSDAFVWLNAFGVLGVGLALLPAGRLARLASVLWLVDGVMKLPAIRARGLDFGAFGLALLVLGCVLWMEAGSREVASAQFDALTGGALVDPAER